MSPGLAARGGCGRCWSPQHSRTPVLPLRLLPPGAAATCSWQREEAAGCRKEPLGKAKKNPSGGAAVTGPAVPGSSLAALCRDVPASGGTRGTAWHSVEQHRAGASPTPHAAASTGCCCCSQPHLGGCLRQISHSILARPGLVTPAASPAAVAHGRTRLCQPQPASPAQVPHGHQLQG